MRNHSPEIQQSFTSEVPRGPAMKCLLRSKAYTGTALLTVFLPGVGNTADYAYTATTANPVRQSGQVQAGAFYWKCSGKACKISGPWPVPGVEACAALAAKVGAITSYGHPTRQLTKTQLAQCNSQAGSTPDVAPISRQIDSSASNTRSSIPLPEVDGKKLVHSLGPQIKEFQVTAGCPYPNRSDSLGFNYRVLSAPDGAAVASIEILQVLADQSTRTVFVTPGTDGRSVLASAPKIVDEAAATDVVRYMLRAADVKRRVSTKLLPSPYWAGLARFEIGPSFTVTRDGSLFVYMVPYSAQSVAPSGAPEPNIRLTGDVRQAFAVDVTQPGSLSNYHADGVEGWWTSYPGNFHRAISGRISFRTRQAVMPDGRLDMPNIHESVVRQYNEWSIGIRLPLAQPAGCGGSSNRSIRATLSGTVNRPPAPSADSEGFTGYPYDIPCTCREPYDDDPTRTRAFDSLIRACMANERGAALMCGLSASKLNPTNTAGRSCTLGGLPRRTDDRPASCYAVPGSIQILRNNR